MAKVFVQVHDQSQRCLPPYQEAPMQWWSKAALQFPFYGILDVILPEAAFEGMHKLSQKTPYKHSHSLRDEGYEGEILIDHFY